MIYCVNADTEILGLYAPETRRALSQQMSAMARLGILTKQERN